MGLEITRLKMMILLESNPLKFRILIRRLAVEHDRLRDPRRPIRRTAVSVAVAEHRALEEAGRNRFGSIRFGSGLFEN